jgi:hypothetical protein
VLGKFDDKVVFTSTSISKNNCAINLI